LQDIDAFFPVSRFTGSLLENSGVDPARVHVVFNGTNLSHFLLSDAERRRLPSWRYEHGIAAGPLLLTAARLVRRKGIDSVLRALPEVARKVPLVQYAVVGSGPEQNSLEALSQQLGLGNRVRFLGHLEEREVV